MSDVNNPLFRAHMLLFCWGKEAVVLNRLAVSELRNPRDQTRYMLRHAPEQADSPDSDNYNHPSEKS